MPLTFIDIEKQKSWRIVAFFLLLMLLYLGVIILLAGPLMFNAVRSTPRFWVGAGLVALVAAAIHFWFSAYDTVNRVVRGLAAQPPDRQDNIHKTFLNVMQEVHVVSGNRRNIQCVVIPSLSMNALAAVDLKGEAVIGITEGLLSRLKRPQLEAVIAHEAHHILSGDCLETTIAASLFGALSAVLEKTVRTYQGRSFPHPAILLAWVILKLSYLLNMFISREREYRADAASVRMTRNPLALAEALHLLSRSWRGSGFIGSGYEMLCIVNPAVTTLDETEGFWADLFSTHPPLQKRIDIMLAMARVSIAELNKKAADHDRRASRISSGPKYYAMDPQQKWQGPFTLAELATMAWLSPLTWITAGQDLPVDRAWKEPLVNAIFTERISREERTASGLDCPSCCQPLTIESYENTQVHQCRYCSGALVENDKIPRILARTDVELSCTERVNALARAVVRENQIKNARQKLSAAARSTIPLYSCPQCKNSMYRGFYSAAYLIEIDRCGFCCVTWFDRNELEMLRCILQSKVLEAPFDIHTPAMP